MTLQTLECDALVIGAGPSGSATAAVLAEQGHRVILLEREKFPRYKVGESLIPHCWFPLQRLGLVDKLDSSPFVVRKHSVQFVGTDGQLSTPFYFSEHSDHDSSRTWQVVRSEFDQLLRDNAEEKGATILEETAARELIRSDNGVEGVIAVRQRTEELNIRAPVTIDASGRDMFAQVRNEWRVPDPKLKKIAVWTYYRGAQRDPGIDEGATTIAYVPGKGWFWYIPLSNDMVSVGIVADRDYLYRDSRDPDEIFDREVGGQPWVKAHLEPGEKTQKCRVTSDYSYRSRYCAENGLVLTGDAFAFLDPVFSSGVFLALQGGVMAGDAVHEALTAGDVSADRFAQYGDGFCDAIEAMRQLVYAFYDETFDFGAFIQERPDLKADLTDCLIGNVQRDFGELFRAVSERAQIPTPLSYGRPLLAS